MHDIKKQKQINEKKNQQTSPIEHKILFLSGSMESKKKSFHT